MIRGRLESATWPPGWMARLLALACFGAGVAAGNCCPVAGPWYVLCFGGILSQNSFFRVFSRKMRSKSVLVYRNEAFCNHSDAYKRQIQRMGTSGLEIRVQGRALVFFLPAFFQRKPGPRPGPGGPSGRCAPRVLPRDTPEGYALPRHRHPASGWVAHRFLALR